MYLESVFFLAEIDNNGICEKLMVYLFESSGPSWHNISQVAIVEWENRESEVVLRNGCQWIGDDTIKWSLL